MRILWPLLIAFIYCPTIYSSTVASCPMHILYLAHTGKTEACISAYQNYFAINKQHDTDFLEQLGLCLLEQGWRSPTPETQLMAIYGAGISINEKASPLLSQAVAGFNPKLQLIALHFLTRWQDDDTDRHLAKALRSNYLIIRMQAAALMAKQKMRQATYHLESLMSKLDSELHVVFPPLFAAINDSNSTNILKKLLNSPCADVRIETIRSIAKTNRDDLLPKIRAMATHGTLGELEACANAFGEFKDELSETRLKILSTNAMPTVRLSALQALYTLGRKEYAAFIVHMAEQGDLFAINHLKDIEGTEDVLKKMLQSSDWHVRLNAAIALLEKRDVACVSFLPQILINDHRDMAFTIQQSPGRTLTHWKAIPSARQNFDDSSQQLERSLSLREDILAKAIDLPQNAFISIVTRVFESRQNDLVPLATQLLEQHQGSNAITLLKNFQQCVGSPLIRNYCNLALCRLGEIEPYRQILNTWVKAQAGESFIQLRPFMPWSADDPLATHEITPEETSRLLLETFQYFAERQDNDGIDLLLEAIKSGNAQNKYALAGLLMRAAM